MTTPSPVAQQVFQALGDYLKRDPSSFQPEDSLRDDLGLDSLMTIELLYEIESVFNLQIPDEDFGGLVTIGDVIRYIEHKTKPRRTRPTSKPAAQGQTKKAASGPAKPAPSKKKRR